MTDYTQDELALAKAIHAALNDDRNGEGAIVYTYNDFFSDTEVTIGIDGDVDLRELARLILKHSSTAIEPQPLSWSLEHKISPIDLGHDGRIKGRQTLGGTIRLPADGIDFDGSYAFKADYSGRTYYWSGIKPERDGAEAEFKLPDQDIAKDSQS